MTRLRTRCYSMYNVWIVAWKNTNRGEPVDAFIWLDRLATMTAEMKG